MSERKCGTCVFSNVNSKVQPCKSCKVIEGSQDNWRDATEDFDLFNCSLSPATIKTIILEIEVRVKPTT